MSSNFYQALEYIREKSNNTTELGSAFEKMVRVFLENDATQVEQYEQVWRYSDWAAEREGYSKKDIGIDLVAKVRGQETFCAIQCKCYDAETLSQKQTSIPSFPLRQTRISAACFLSTPRLWASRQTPNKCSIT